MELKMNYYSLITLLICLWVFFTEDCLAVRLTNFEDFLMNHHGHESATTPPPTEYQPSFSGSWEDEGSGMESDFLSITTTIIPTTLPRSRMTCCDLGKLAGQNNFECNPNNYGPEMSDRNANRGYGNFKRNQPSQRHSFTQVKQFGKCISGRVRELAWDFQKCCKRAFRELQDQQRRDEMILTVPVNVNDNNKPSRTIFHIERDQAGDTHKVPAILGVELAEEDYPPQHNRRASHPHQQKRHNRRW
ncbi:uncharacterized protein [Amphiura filiformis]|uniref:uncharacterized protein n=1 Tax=Amphiura filiformis TaxID=82378 RepID=UPI003B20FA86